MNQCEKNSGRSSTKHSRAAACAGLLALMFASASVSCAQTADSVPSAQKQSVVASEYGKLPLSFERNEGQADPRVKFIAQGQGYSLSLTRDGALLFLHGGTDSKAEPESTATPQIKLAGANLNPEIVGTEELPGKVNYILGNDPKKWRTNVPTFAQVLYKDVYPGIDLVFHGNQGKLEFDFIVRPGADPNLIQIKDLGLNALTLKQTGDLVAQVRGGEIVLKKPVTYQKTNSGPQLLASNFVVRKNGRIAFHVNNYDQSEPLIIDPELVYSTFVGNSSSATGTGIAVDAAGSAYITGFVLGGEFPTTPGAYNQGPYSVSASSITKLLPNGSGLAYSTYFGGTTYGKDQATAIAVDSSGAAYVTGVAFSSDFPTTANSFEPLAPPFPPPTTATSLDYYGLPFVLKLSSDGSALVYSTYLDGYHHFIDLGRAIAVDANGDAYVSGSTTSTDFPVTAGAFQTVNPATPTNGGYQSEFVAELNPSGSSVLWATYLGGSASTGSYFTEGTYPYGGIALDPAGNVYVTDMTYASDFTTTPGAFQTVYKKATSLNPVADAFVAKFTSDGKIVYSTLLGGSYSDTGMAIAADASGSAYVFGTTFSSDFPTTPAALQKTCAGGIGGPAGSTCEDTFVTKLSADGTSAIYSTFLGGSGVDNAGGITTDSTGNAIVMGLTGSIDFPTTTSINFDNNCTNGYPCLHNFVARLSADGSTLLYSTNFGSGTEGNPGSIAVDWLDNAYITGGTVDDAFFPTTPGSYQPAPSSGPSTPYVPFVAKFALGPAAPGIGFVPLGENFGQLAIGFSQSANVLVTNIGAANLVFGLQPPYSTTTPGSAPFTVDATACPASAPGAGEPYTLVPGASCTVVMSFAPAVVGPNVGGVTFIDNAAIGNPVAGSGGMYTQVYPLTGVGAANTLAIVPASIPVGAVGLFYGPVTFTAPSGTGPLTWLETGHIPNGITFLNGILQGIPTESGTFQFALQVKDQNNNAGATIASVTIYPGTTASLTSSLTTLTCSPPVLSTATASITCLDFGGVLLGTPKNQTLTLNNTGSSNLYIQLSILGLGPNPFSVPISTCNVLESTPPSLNNGIPPGGSCQMTIAFTPPSLGPVPSETWSLELFDSAGTQTVYFTGAGVAPGPTLVSIAVTPVNPTVGVGTTEQFTATGTYSDSSTKDLTTSVNWTSTSTPATTVATINSSTGLAAAVAAGTSTIQAALGSVTGSTTLTVTSSTGGGTPGCGCSKTGSYVSLVKGIVPSSSSSQFTATPVTSPSSSLLITDKSGKTVFNQSFQTATSWGFSPDGSRLETNNVQSGEETVSIYNLTSGSLPVINPEITFSVNASSARIEFSPSGQYLLYEAVPTSNQATLRIYNLQFGQKVYEDEPSFSAPGSGTDQYGVLGDWGFSPDSPETSFTYTYLNSSGSPQLELVHLEQPPSSGTNGVATTIPLTDIIADHAKYSPCGDALAVLLQPSGQLQIDLYRTADGNHVGLTATSLALTDMAVADPATAPTSQVVEDTNGNVVATLAADSSFNLGCSALNVPAGSNVTVQPTATWTGTGPKPTGVLPAPVTLNFTTVNSPGGQVSLTETNTGAAPPVGFALGNPAAAYYDLTEIPNTLTTPGNITICIDYSGITFSGQPALFHNGSATPLQLSLAISPNPDTTNHIICAITPSLSPFAIFGAAGPVSTTTALTSSVSTSVEGQTLILTAQIAPSLAGSPTGTVTFSDGATVLGTGPLTGAGTASITTSLLPAGPNSITAVYSGDTYFAGSTSTALALTVTPASLTITANSSSRQYAAVDSAFTVSYSGFVNGDGPGSLSGALNCTAGDTASSPVGTYAINCFGLSSANYAITYMPGTLTITPVPLMVAANNAARPYGANNPAFAGTVTGLLNADPISATFSSSATPSSPVGPYAVVPALLGAPGVLGNYTITIVNGTLSVVPETTSLSVTLAPPSIPVGLSTTVTVTLTAPDMVIAIDPSVLAPVTVSSPIVSDILTNNGTCTPVSTSAPGVAACTITLTAVEPNGRTLNASFAGTSALVTSAGTADLVVTAPLESKVSCINSDFRNVSVPGGSYLWFNSIFKVREVPKQKVTISFFQSSVQFQYTDASNNVVTVNQPMPDAKIVIDPSVTTASTTFDSVNNVWITTIPFDLDDNTFLTGMPWLVPAGGLPADVEPVSWCGTFASDTAGIDIGWRWTAAAYSSFSSDSTVLGVKPMNTDHDNSSPNHDNAGTPENFKTYVIPGGRGKGGKNYTGSYSGSAIIE